MPARKPSSAAKLTVNGTPATGKNGLGRRLLAHVSGYDRASARTQSSLARRVQPAGKREIRAVYNVKASILNNTMRLARVEGGAIVLSASKRRLPLIQFGGAWGGRLTAGATASILLGQRRTYESAFVAASRGQKAIFVRQRGSGGRRDSRAPLQRLYGPSVFDMIAPSAKAGSAPNRIRERVISQMESFYVTELARQIKLELTRG